MYCTICGSKIREGAKFCDECGTRINYVDGQPAHNNLSSSKPQQSTSNSPFGDTYANNISIGGMNIVKYAGVWLGVVILSMLWLFVPVIAPNTPHIFEMVMRTNSSEYAEEFNYSLPGILQIFFRTMGNVSDALSKMPFLTIMIFATAICAIVLLGYAVATGVSLIKKSARGINGNCQGFIAWNVVVAVALFVLTLAFNKQAGSDDLDKMLHISLSGICYVIPVLALVLKFVILDRADQEQATIGGQERTGIGSVEPLFRDETHIETQTANNKLRHWTCSSCGRENPIDSAHCQCGNKKSI